MEIRTSNSLLESLVAQRFSQGTSTPAPRPGPPPPNGDQARAVDTVSLSRALVTVAPEQNTGASQTRLVKDIVEEMDRGFRRTQTFERPDGRTFTRMEEFTAADKGARRSVIQQNASGNTTRLDEVFERQDNGTFRRVQRFTDEAGETSTHIETGYVATNPFILSGGTAEAFAPPAHQVLRGTQLDLHA